jgi:hypothetical protein
MYNNISLLMNTRRTHACIKIEHMKIVITGGIKMGYSYSSKCEFRNVEKDVHMSREVLDLNNIKKGWQEEYLKEIPEDCEGFLCFGPSQISVRC